MFYANEYVRWNRADLDREFLVIIAPRNGAPGVIEDDNGYRFIATEDEMSSVL